MNAESPASLPWDQLNCQQGDVPWSALHTFANAVVADRELIPRLFDLYDRAYEAFSDDTGVADLLVAGIFAMAAPGLDEQGRREIATLLIERLVQAGRDDADLEMEVLAAAAGTMGPVILPAVLDAIAAEPDTRGAWVYLWGFTVLAAKTSDLDLRERVVHACAEQLQRIDRGQADPGDGGQAAWTLAALKRIEYADLIRRVSAKAEGSFWVGDYEDSLKLLRDQLDYTPPEELWEQPVEEWLTPRCEDIWKWEDKPDDYEDEDELEAEEEVEKDPDSLRADLMAAAFCASPVAFGLPQELRSNANRIVKHLLYCSFVDLELAPSEWDESALRELLLDIMPRKLLPTGKKVEMLIPITEALLYWLHFEEFVRGADGLAQTIHGWTNQVVAAGSDPKNWGPNKQYMMETLEAGLDPTEPQTKRAFVEQQISESVEALSALAPQQQKEKKEHEPPIPIVEHELKIARNAPCPCGSGRKYKKCCGRSKTTASDR